MKLSMRLALGLTLVVAMTGCSNQRSNITGTITQDGKPLVAETEEGHLLVLFVPAEWKPDSQVFRAQTDRTTGSFSLPEIRAGKYLVAIQQFDGRHRDALNSKYDPTKSPLRFDVTEDGQVIEIDLPK